MKKQFAIASVFLWIISFLPEVSFCEEAQKNQVAPGLGIVKLKLHKILTIDSSAAGEKDPPLFVMARKSTKKNIILLLSRKPSLSIYGFDDKGLFKNRFLSKGEGPGELPSVGDIQIIDDQAIVTSYGFRKIATFNLNGKLEEEKRQKILSYFNYFIDINQYIGNITEMDTAGAPIRRLVMLDKRKDEIIAHLCEDEKRRDIGATMVMNQQLYHDWVTPDYKFVYLEACKRLVCGVSDGDLLILKDLQGHNIKTVKMNYPRKMMSEGERERLLKSLEELKKYPEMYKGFLEKIPSQLLSIMDLKPLPMDHFAVLLVAGIDRCVVRIYNKNLDYLYDIEFPDDIAARIVNLRRINFYEKGIYAIEESDEENRYVEYQIENMKTIFR